MKIVTSDEMKNIDCRTIEKFGIPGSVLMERAGLAVAQKVRELFEKKKVIVLAGGGNNGGDGIVAARNLHNFGWNVKVLLMLREDRLSPDCLAQYRMAKKSGVSIEFRKDLNEKDIHGSIVVDALLGTGINKSVTSPMSDVIRFLNRAEVKVISVDVPTGISADTGQIMGEAVQADYTVTFGLRKIGHVLYPGSDFSGRVFVEDIGFPVDLLVSDSLSIETIEKNEVSGLIPERPGCSHKGDYGHILIVAGSRGRTGAALMAAKACMRTGAGLVTLGVPETLVDVFQSRVTEEMILPLPDTGQGTLSEKAYDIVADFLDQKADILAIGPGIGVDENTAVIVRKIIGTVTSPIVLDADAINVLAGKAELLKKAKAPIVLTPHLGEMTRLIKSASGKVSGNSVKDDPVNSCLAFSKETGVYLVLKGSPTIVSDYAGRLYINTTGNPGMATAGSGDVLTGMIAALLGQSVDPLDACRAGVYLHGLAGDLAAESKGMHSMISSDIIECIPGAFLSLV